MPAPDAKKRQPKHKMPPRTPDPESRTPILKRRVDPLATPLPNKDGPFHFEALPVGCNLDDGRSPPLIADAKPC